MSSETTKNKEGELQKRIRYYFDVSSDKNALLIDILKLCDEMKQEYFSIYDRWDESTEQEQKSECVGKWLGGL